MRWVSVVLFLVIVIFGAVRFGSSADLNAKQAQTKVQALREMQRPLPAGRADSHHVVDPVATQEAEQANQSAQQNVATFQIIQIILTFLAVVLTVFIIYLILAGKQVDKVVKGFTLWVYDEHHRLLVLCSEVAGLFFRARGVFSIGHTIH
jgi:hypothetical protein